MEKLDKAKNQAEYTLKLLRLCKTRNGPATSVKELHEILKSNSEKAEKIVRTELSYYRDTHKSDVLNHPDLYKLNKVLHEERLVNLGVLLAGNSSSLGSVSLPSNDDAIKVLKTSVDPEPEADENDIMINQYYITLIAEGNVDN